MTRAQLLSLAMSTAGRAVKACLPGLPLDVFLAIRDTVALAADGRDEEQITTSLRAAVLDIRAAYKLQGGGDWKPSAASAPLILSLLAQGLQLQEEPEADPSSPQPVEGPAEKSEAPSAAEPETSGEDEDELKPVDPPAPEPAPVPAPSRSPRRGGRSAT